MINMNLSLQEKNAYIRCGESEMKNTYEETSRKALGIVI